MKDTPYEKINGVAIPVELERELSDEWWKYTVGVACVCAPPCQRSRISLILVVNDG